MQEEDYCKHVYFNFKFRTRNSLEDTVNAHLHKLVR